MPMIGLEAVGESKIPKEIGESIQRYVAACYRNDKIRESDPQPFALSIMLEVTESYENLCSVIAAEIQQARQEGYELGRGC